MVVSSVAHQPLPLGQRQPSARPCLPVDAILSSSPLIEAVGFTCTGSLTGSGSPCASVGAAGRRERDDGSPAARAWLAGVICGGAIAADVGRHAVLRPEHLAASGVQPIGGHVGAARHCGSALVVQRRAGSLVSRIVGQGWLFADDASLQPRLGGGDQFIGRAVLAVVRPFEREAALHQHAVHLLHVEGVADVLDGLLVVEVLAREDVHREVVQLGEGVDGDVALGDDDQARDAGIGGVGGLVLEHVRAADFGHANGGGIIVQHLLDEDAVCELAGITTGAIDDQVGSEHARISSTMRNSAHLWANDASCFRSGNSRYTS